MTFRSVAFAALAWAVVGCAVLPAAMNDDCASRANGGAEGGCGLISGTDGGGADGYAVPWGDASLDAGAPAVLARASLCAGDCSPDDPLACAGDAGADADVPVTESCRVILGVNHSSSAACATAGQGLDGVSCTQGSDCAPGYECVGNGTCRHYCCDDSACTTLSSTTYDTYFCDIASEHPSSGAIVPVCQIANDCQLLSGTDACGAGQGCTLVEIDNGNSFIRTCADLGDAKQGQSCETTHCAKNLACWGAMGERTCQQLCDDQNPCALNSATPNCNKSAPQLAKMGVGICGP